MPLIRFFEYMVKSRGASSLAVSNVGMTLGGMGETAVVTGAAGRIGATEGAW